MFGTWCDSLNLRGNTHQKMDDNLFRKHTDAIDTFRLLPTVRMHQVLGAHLVQAEVMVEELWFQV